MNTTEVLLWCTQILAYGSMWKPTAKSGKSRKQRMPAPSVTKIQQRGGFRFGEAVNCHFRFDTYQFFLMETSKSLEN